MDRLIQELDQVVQIAEHANSTIYPDIVKQVAEDMRALLGIPSTLQPLRPVKAAE